MFFNSSAASCRKIASGDVGNCDFPKVVAGICEILVLSLRLVFEPSWQKLSGILFGGEAYSGMAPSTSASGCP